MGTTCTSVSFDLLVLVSFTAFLGAEGRVFESCRPDQYLSHLLVPGAANAYEFAASNSPRFDTERIMIFAIATHVDNKRSPALAVPGREIAWRASP